jgi:hypothetical protein
MIFIPPDKKESWEMIKSCLDQAKIVANPELKQRIFKCDDFHGLAKVFAAVRYHNIELTRCIDDLIENSRVARDLAGILRAAPDGSVNILGLKDNLDALVMSYDQLSLSGSRPI